MYVSQILQPDVDDDFVIVTKSDEAVGHVSIQIYPAKGGGYVSLVFGALGEMNGIAVIDKLVAGLLACRAELLRRAVANPDVVIPEPPTPKVVDLANATPQEIADSQYWPDGKGL